MNKKLITELSDEMMDKWFGPSGDCWCEEKKKNVKPGTCPGPECQALGLGQTSRPFRYVQEEDYKTVNDKVRYL